MTKTLYMLDPEFVPDEIARVCGRLLAEESNSFLETRAYFLGEGCVHHAEEYILFKRSQVAWDKIERRLQDRRLPAILKEQAI